jgi:N-acetylneuraminic acid mutarotase
MLLIVPVTALFIGCGEHPNSGPSHRTNGVAIQGTPRADRALSGIGWTINAPIPEPLGVAQGATVASADGSLIYHIGGITGAMTATNKVRVYSIADNTWFDAADIPVAPGIRTFGAAVELNGFVYVFGGFDGTNILDTTWIYDEANDVWFQGTNMPEPRFDCAATTDGTVIWVAGGYQGFSAVDDSHTGWRYDPNTNSWPEAHNIPAQMGRSRAVLLPNGDLHLLSGGFDGNTHMIINFLHYVDSRPQIPFGVTDPAVVTDGVRIYVAGGGGPAPRAAGRTQIFNTVSRTWSLGPPMPSGVDNTSGVIANGTLYVMGGYDGSTPVSINYSLPLSSLGGQETISAGSMDSEALEAFDTPESQLRRQVNGSLWSTNWPIPELFGVAQGSTVASSDGLLIYHIGGWVGDGLYLSNRMRVYSPAADSGDASAMRSPWWDVASVPGGGGIRSYGSAVELSGFIYIFGGVAGQSAVLNTTWIYDEANDIWFQGANMPGPRAGPAVATDGAVIWVIGGYNAALGPDHTVWRYNPTADAYSTGFTNMPRDLGRIHGVWLSDGTVHVLGGGEAGSLNNHLVYDTSANTWSSAPLVPIGVLDPATVTDGLFIYLAGSPQGIPFPPGYSQIFDPLRGTWSEGPRMPGPWGVDNTSGTIANGFFYVMGGFYGAAASINYSIAMSELSPSNGQ